MFKNLLIKVFILLILGSCSDIKREVLLFMHKRHIDAVESNPDSLLSAKTLAIMCTTFGKEKTEELYSNLTQRVKDSEDGKVILRYLQLNKDPEIGERYVDFDMEDTTGSIQRLSDLEGKVVLLEFWASWCGPCIREIPNLKTTYDKFHPEGFEIFAVSMDSGHDDWVSAINKHDMNWIHVSDLADHDNTASFIYGVHGIPDNFLIDQEGVIIGRDLTGDDLNNILAEQIKIH